MFILIKYSTEAVLCHPEAHSKNRRVLWSHIKSKANILQMPKKIYTLLMFTQHYFHNLHTGRSCLIYSLLHVWRPHMVLKVAAV